MPARVRIMRVPFHMASVPQRGRSVMCRPPGHRPCRPFMKIEKDRVVRFHYTVAEPGQPALETSREGEPLALLYGHGGIIPGLEAAMAGREAGESFEVSVAPAEGYGERREGMTQRVPRKHFKGARLHPGMQV